MTAKPKTIAQLGLDSKIEINLYTYTVMVRNIHTVSLGAKITERKNNYGSLFCLSINRIHYKDAFL